MSIVSIMYPQSMLEIMCHLRNACMLIESESTPRVPSFKFREARIFFSPSWTPVVIDS